MNVTIYLHLNCVFSNKFRSSDMFSFIGIAIHNFDISTKQFKSAQPHVCSTTMIAFAICPMCVVCVQMIHCCHHTHIHSLWALRLCMRITCICCACSSFLCYASVSNVLILWCWLTLCESMRVFVAPSLSLSAELSGYDMCYVLPL